MNYGKSIRLFLVEGTADGRWMRTVKLDRKSI